jgi:UDP-N-acetylmuramoylalanine--D-glutamate ligase
MIPIAAYKGKKLGILGLGKTGQSAMKALIRSGVHVVVWDDHKASLLETIDRAIYWQDWDWSSLAGLVLSPGIPHRLPKPHPAVVKAKEMKVPLLSDLDLLALSQPNCQFIAVTGTNGKSTTTTLIAHLLKTAGKSVQFGGNIGIPALDLTPFNEKGIYVLEISSYQAELINYLTFDVAVLLNIQSDHQERHGGIQGYVAAKKRLFTQGKPALIIGVDDNYCRKINQEFSGSSSQPIFPISKEQVLSGGFYAQEGCLFDNIQTPIQEVLNLEENFALKGAHNWQNAAAACAAVHPFNIDLKFIRQGLKTFSGLAHRQELILESKGVTFVNDSKATNVAATTCALTRFENIYWIAGGRPKKSGLEGVLDFLEHVKHAFLIGESSLKFAEYLKNALPITISGTLEKAIQDAYQLALQDGLPCSTVLLSPACASFDQFENFEKRGEVFRDAIQKIGCVDHLQRA